MDRITEMLGRLSALSEGEMSDLEGTIIAEFETVEQQEPTAEIVDTMTALADALDAVRSEQSQRLQNQDALAAKAAEQSSRIRQQAAAAEEASASPAAELATETADSAELAAAVTEPGAMPASDEETEPEPEMLPDEEESPAEEEKEVTEGEEPEEMVFSKDAVEVAELSTDTTQPATQIEENPVAASASDVVVKAPAEMQPTAVTRPPVTVTAGADIPGISAGSSFTDLASVSDAFIKRLHALRRVTGGDGEQHIVASIHADYPEDRTLHQGSSAENWEKIQRITSREALVAAATCYPLDTQYNLFGVGVADRPVRDSLAMFSADRGGLRYYTAPTLASIPIDNTGPIGFWKQDGSVTSVAGASLSGVKPCYTVACGDEKEVLLEAVSLCLTFDNLMTRANPEIVARHNELALINHARVTELYVLGAIKTGGTAVAAKNYNVGAAREWFAQLDGIAAAYRYKYRMADRQPLRTIAPVWFRDMIRADIAMQMPGDGLESLGLAQSMIDGWLRQRNINATWSLDSVAAAPSATTGAFGATVEWDLFAEGTWLYLDGGTLDIGVIRDSTLVGANDYKTFSEEFMAVAKIGDESLHITSTVSAAGAAAALEDNFS